MRILAIDGGGVRGIIPALVLEELEQRSGLAVHELFDYVVGTSTGGIIALALAAPGDGGGARFTAADVVRFYKEEAAHIFPHEHFATARQLYEEKYPAHGLETALTAAFGGVLLSEAIVDVMVTTYDAAGAEPLFLRRSLARADPDLDLPMWQAARATAAAPTYFPPLVYRAGAQSRVFIDGGVVANNPVMSALAHGHEAGGDLSHVIAVSLGTGDVRRALRLEHQRHLGVAQWAAHLFALVSDGTSAAMDHHAAELIGPDHHHRFNVQLDDAQGHFDNADPANLAALTAAAGRLIAAADERLDRVTQLLLASGDERRAQTRGSPIGSAAQARDTAP